MKLQRIFPVIVLLFFILAVSALAQAGSLSVEATSLKGSPIITASYIFQLFMSLLIVFGLMYLISKYVIPRIKVTSQSKYIQVIDKIGLEPQVGAYIIKVNDAKWLVVVSNKNVSVVSKLESL